MIRFTWRQFRPQALVALGTLLAVAIVVLVTHAHLVHMFSESANNAPLGLYDRIVSFLEQALNFVVLAVPALIGMFWGAPLVAREFESGTFRLAWTQGVTRTRWLVVKLSVIGLASMIVAGLFSLIVTWWSRPIDSASLDRFETVFSERGMTPMGYALFAFALGVTAGVLIRRIQPAMVTTLVAFIATRVAVTFWVRQHLWPPAHTSLALTSSQVQFAILRGPSGLMVYASTRIPNAWVYSTEIVDKAGHAPSAQVITSLFGNVEGPGGTTKIGPASGLGQNLQAAIAKLAPTYHALVTYQPASRYWAFQGLETAIFIALAVALAGVSFWWCTGAFEAR